MHVSNKGFGLLFSVCDYILNISLQSKKLSIHILIQAPNQEYNNISNSKLHIS